jgi:hypothetical protein
MDEGKSLNGSIGEDRDAAIRQVKSVSKRPAARGLMPRPVGVHAAR